MGHMAHITYGISWTTYVPYVTTLATRRLAAQRMLRNKVLFVADPGDVVELGVLAVCAESLLLNGTVTVLERRLFRSASRRALNKSASRKRNAAMDAAVAAIDQPWTHALLAKYAFPEHPNIQTAEDVKLYLAKHKISARTVKYVGDSLFNEAVKNWIQETMTDVRSQPDFAHKSPEPLLVIGGGNWNAKSGSSSLVAFLASHFLLTYSSEYNSSSKCPICGADHVEPTAKERGSKSTTSRTKRCSNTACAGHRLVHRDLVAPLSISVIWVHSIFGVDLPEHFQKPGEKNQKAEPPDGAGSSGGKSSGSKSSSKSASKSASKSSDGKSGSKASSRKSSSRKSSGMSASKSASDSASNSGARKANSSKSSPGSTTEPEARKRTRTGSAAALPGIKRLRTPARAVPTGIVAATATAVTAGAPAVVKAATAAAGGNVRSGDDGLGRSGGIRKRLRSGTSSRGTQSRPAKRPTGHTTNGTGPAPVGFGQLSILS